MNPKQTIPVIVDTTIPRGVVVGYVRGLLYERGELTQETYHKVGRGDRTLIREVLERRFKELQEREDDNGQSDSVKEVIDQIDQLFPQEIAATDVPALARDGFIAIRWALRHHNVKQALDIAEALHNVPDEGNDIQQGLTVDAIKALLEQYPEEGLVQDLGGYIGATEVQS